ncbi:hypothetical protein M0R04_11305 [Candidatus Dojkabacteria bacterium]|nr:hypothetical protein [Candidatus Dojkabacteria bacterium]
MMKYEPSPTEHNEEWYLKHNPQKVATFMCDDCGEWVRQDRLEFHECPKDKKESPVELDIWTTNQIKDACIGINSILLPTKWIKLERHNEIVAKLKQELAESIPKAQLQHLQDMIKKEMEIAHKANTNNGNQSWQTLNMIRVQIDKLLGTGKGEQ